MSFVAALRSLFRSARPDELSLTEPFLLDYAQHPAFKPLLTPDITAKAGDADRLYATLQSDLARLGPVYGVGALKGVIGRFFSALAALYPGDDAFARFCAASADETADYLAKSAALVEARRHHADATAAIPENSIYADLRD